MWLTKTLCAALSCSLCLFLFLSSNVIKKTKQLPDTVCPSSDLLIVALFSIKLWRFVKHPEEGSPAAHRGKQFGSACWLLSANQES